ncbi:MAG: hypothetical protein ABW328_04150 [Ilumatobacteraceae bacterium]
MFETGLRTLEAVPRRRLVGLTSDLPAPSPLPRVSPALRRALRHPRLMQHNRLIVAVLTANVAAAGAAIARGGWWRGDATNLVMIATVAQANLLLAAIPRQHFVINLVGWLATRPSNTWPLRVRWMLGKYYHLGGLHVGAAVAGTLWYLAFVGSSTVDLARGAPSISLVNVVLSMAVVVLFVVMVVMALPRFRARNHDRFELTHRLGAWSALLLVWVNTVLLAGARHPGQPIVVALMDTPSVWLLVVTTVLAVWPWLLLRKVSVTIDRPSSHVALVGLDHGVTPPIGTTRAISRRPLVGWHHFANVPAAPGAMGYRMVVSRAGDWTSTFIDDPPEHVWVRGVPTVGVANVKRLFTKVVYVVTGSGIGPALGHLLADDLPSKLVWVTRNPHVTYGSGLVDEVLAAQPDALIWNTDERGKPDILRLAHATYVDAGAEAVICIANREVTWQVVHGLEQRGIPAFGPIWDS